MKETGTGSPLPRNPATQTRPPRRGIFIESRKVEFPRRSSTALTPGVDSLGVKLADFLTEIRRFKEDVLCAKAEQPIFLLCAARRDDGFGSGSHGEIDGCEAECRSRAANHDSVTGAVVHRSLGAQPKGRVSARQAFLDHYVH